VDLGILTVPQGHRHDGHLGAFRREQESKFFHFDGAVTDKNFPQPSTILRPRDKFWVLAFRHSGEEKLTAEDRMEFLKRQEGNVFVGPQGASLIFEQRALELPRGHWYASLDEPENCWDDEGFRGFGYLVAHADGDFEFNVGYHGQPLHNVMTFFQFVKIA
jgi:hypothetical protein